MYQVLYRKWRPATFEDVIGQGHVTDVLKKEILNNTVAHAYLFTGSRGTGKTTCAKILSKAINCLSPVDGEPCNICSNCTGIDDGSVLDVSEIDAASNNGVDNIRDLREESIFTPAIAKKRVYIIDEVHMLSVGAFNALLKTLEEPPEHVMFILATTEVHKIPATILSRCQRFDFKRIEPEDIKNRLMLISKEENIIISEDAAMLIARLADGAMRDALSLLDKLKSEESGITEETVAKTLGLAGGQVIFELADKIIEKKLNEIIKIINDLHKVSRSMIRLCEDLIIHFRNLMLVKTVKSPQGFMKYSSSDIEYIYQQSEKIILTDIMKMLNMLQASLDKSGTIHDSKLLIEMMFIDYCSNQNESINLDEINNRINKIETKIKSIISNEVNISENKSDISKIDKESKEKPNKKNDEPKNEHEQKESNSLDFYISHEDAKPFEKWDAVLKELAKTSKPLLGVLEGSKAFVQNNYLLIDSENSMFAILIKQPGYKETLRNAVFKITGTRYSLGPYKKAVTENTEENDLLTALENQLKKSGVEYNIT